MPGKVCRGLLAALALVLLCGCSSPITPSRVETAVQNTFAHLVELQMSRLRLPPIAAQALVVRATCRKQLTGQNAGAGDWTCALAWQGPDRQALQDTYDLFVATDGCYTATVASETLGGPTLRTTDGTSVRNLLYEFEGCFDTM